MTDTEVAAAHSSPTGTDGVCANGAASGLRKGKKKKRKRKGYAALMSEITAPASKAPREAERRRQLLRHLGGGAFSKLDKI